MTTYTVQDDEGDDVDITSLPEEGLIEVSEGMASDPDIEVFTRYTPDQARKLALRLLQAAHEVDPS